MGACSYDLELLQTLSHLEYRVVFFSRLSPTCVSKPYSGGTSSGQPSQPLHCLSEGPPDRLFPLGTSLNSLFLICKMSLRITLILKSCSELDELTEKLFSTPLGVYQTLTNSGRCRQGHCFLTMVSASLELVLLTFQHLGDCGLTFHLWMLTSLTVSQTFAQSSPRGFVEQPPGVRSYPRCWGQR